MLFFIIYCLEEVYGCSGDDDRGVRFWCCSGVVGRCSGGGWGGGDGGMGMVML